MPKVYLTGIRALRRDDLLVLARQRVISWDEYRKKVGRIENQQKKINERDELKKQEAKKKEEERKKKEKEIFDKAYQAAVEGLKKREEERKKKEDDEKNKKEEELRKKIEEERKKKEEEIKIKKELELKKKKDKRDELYYPELNDSKFNEKLLGLKEIRVHNIPNYPEINTIQDFENKAKELCKTFDKSSFQYLIAHYLSYRTPYKSLLLYYSVGVGKTCTAITIAEGLLYTHSSSDEPIIWVILPNAIEAGFKRQIFDVMKMTDFKTCSVS